MNKMKILVTGAAGFIGFHLVQKLITDGHEIIGLDSINAYYNVRLKLDRLEKCGIQSGDLWYNRILKSNQYDNYHFLQLNLEDLHNIENLFSKYRFDVVVHLAAQAGVRYSIDNPKAYIDSNIVGFHNILEACRQFPVQHLVYASSSSVYGNNKKTPFAEDDPVDHPISLYAATKKSNELLAYTYSHLFGIKSTGLRFFTVYGPWGRPDMAYYKFTEAILHGHPIQVYNHGLLKRDFTYIDDIIDGVNSVINNNSHTGDSTYSIYNIGNNQPAPLLEFITILEDILGIEAKKEFLLMQDGDVEITYADISRIHKAYGFTPKTTLRDGLGKFISWYKEYHQSD